MRVVTRICAAVIILFTVAGILSAADPETEFPVLVEAEGFADTGGWVVDPQFMDLMGSPYLLAHGLGVPVGDAKTEVVISKAGQVAFLKPGEQQSGWTVTRIDHLTGQIDLKGPAGQVHSVSVQR